MQMEATGLGSRSAEIGAGSPDVALGVHRLTRLELLDLHGVDLVRQG